MAKTAPVPSQSDILQRRDVLKSRRSKQHQVMRALEPWEQQDKAALYDTIWRGNPPENPERWTVVKPDIASTTETVTSFLSARRPHIMVTPKEAVRKQGKDAANAVERLGYAAWDTMDRDRQQSILAESARPCISRGEMIGKILWLSPEERGETAVTVEASDYSIGLDENEPTTAYEEQGEFPVLWQVLDPLECYYSIGKGDKLLQFVHEFQAPPDYLMSLFPDLDSQKEFSYIAQATTGSFTVTDYWDETYNAIMIDNRFYKEPTEHEYPCIPVVVELAKPHYRRFGENLGPSMVGTPFCAHMLDHLIDLSFADSVSKRYLANNAYGNYTLEGIDPENSVHVRQVDGKTVFDLTVDLGPDGKVIPLFHNEKLRAAQPPPIVEQLQEFKGARSRDVALVSFQEGILTGAYNVDLSGYSVAQQKQAAMARVAPYELALNRFLSRMMQMVFKIMAAEWDRDEDAEMVLTQLVSAGRGTTMVEEEVPLSLEMLHQIASVRVEIDPEVPTNREQEWTLFIQMFTTQLLSAQSVLELTGAVQDPSKEIERIMFETMARQDPQIMAAVAHKYMRENGIIEAQPAQQPAADPMAALAGGMPPDPAMMGQDPAMMGGDPMAAMMAGGGGGMDPMMGGGGDPELDALIQQLMAGG